MEDRRGEWVCPVCGHQVTDPSARFCDIDGARLERSVSAQPSIPVTATVSQDQRPSIWKRLARIETLLLLFGLALIGVSIALLVYPTSDTPPSQPVQKKSSAQKGTSPSAPAQKAETDDSPLGRLLQDCYGKRPDTPKTPAQGPEGPAYEKAKKDMKAGMDMVIGATTPDPTREEQTRIGDDTVRELKRRFGNSADQQQQARLASVTKRLTQIAPRNGELAYRFDLLAKKDINAFMGAGGHGAVFQGLVDAMPDDGSLAWVIGHELAHSELHHIDHQLRTMMAGRRLGEMAGGPRGKDIGEVIAGLATKMLSSTYDQDQEFESDMVGLCLMKKAGFSPDAALRALDIIHESSSQVRAPEQGAIRIAYDILITHPPARDRRLFLSELIGMMSK